LNDLLAGLHALGRCTEVELQRLSRAATAVLAEQVAGHRLAEVDADQFYRETEGNPLFVVEALRAGWQGRHAGSGWTTPRVQAVIEARLGQLSASARELVGLAATIGRAFSSEVLAHASEADEETLVQDLDQLWRRRILIAREGTDVYDFSHDKIREVAYLGLSPVRRRHHHRRLAHALERLHVHDLGPVSGQIAGHYERAGAAGQAATWYGRAAAAAQRLYANVDAIRCLDRALDLLRSLPETPERQSRELALLTALSTLLGWVEGWGSERLAAVQQRALDLTRALGVEPAAPLFRSLAIASLSRRDFAAAGDLGQQLYARGERDADDVLRVEADYVLGIAAFWQGELDAARRHFESAVDRYRPEHRRAHLHMFGFDPKVICLSRLGNTLWFLGRSEAAERMRDEALLMADQIGHPYSRAIALVFAALLALEMRDAERLRAYTAMLKSEQGEHGTRPTQASSEALEGYLEVLDGREEDGKARIQRALADTRRADHAPGLRAHMVRVLLEACAVAGDARTGLAAADWALAWGDADRLWEAETRRLRAAFLAALGAPGAEIEAELGRALQIASRQGARLFELRTAPSLLRHRLEHGGGPGLHAARELLTNIVHRFVDGHDTQDVREAARLLGRS
jgi:tetratricopeptide (TPR) repeat protein